MGLVLCHKQLNMTRTYNNSNFKCPCLDAVLTIPLSIIMVIEDASMMVMSMIKTITDMD